MLPPVVQSLFQRRRFSPVRLVFVQLLLWAWLWMNAEGKQCRKLNQCSCLMDDESGVVDISSLGLTTGKPRFFDQLALDGLRYSYNPCYSFSENSCTNVAVCQTNGKSLYQKAGDQSTASWSFDGSYVVVSYYSSTDSFRQSLVKYQCDRTATNPKMVAIGETELGLFELEVTTKCACPGECYSKTQIEITISLSTGWVLIIIFLCVMFFYCVSVTTYNRFARNAHGREMVPNASFWGSLPGLIGEGFRFTFSFCHGSPRKGYDQV